MSFKCTASYFLKVVFSGGCDDIEVTRSCGFPCKLFGSKARNRGRQLTIFIKQRERKCHNLLFLHSIIPDLSLSLPKCPTPIGFQTLTSSLGHPVRYFTVHFSIHCIMAWAESGPSLEWRARHASKWHYNVRVREAVNAANRRQGGTHCPCPVILPVHYAINWRRCCC